MDRAIFLSASIPDPTRSPDLAKTADEVAIVSAVSSLLYVTLGRRPLVWGGHPAITPMVLEVCEAMNIDYKNWVRLYQSEYFSEEFPEDNERFGNTRYTPVAVDKSRESSLLLMRKQMLTENNFDAAVFIGGMDGIFEELSLFSKYHTNADVLPIASTGGAALHVARKLFDTSSSFYEDLDYIRLFHEKLHIASDEPRSTSLKA